MRYLKNARVPLVVVVAVGAVAVGILSTLSVRSLTASPASAGPSAPNPGHPWTEVEGHGIDGSTYWLGTTSDQALELRVNGERAQRIEPATYGPNIIGGYSGNSVTSGVRSATIGGGGGKEIANRVTDDFGTVGGGAGNQAGDAAGSTWEPFSTVGGGLGNVASSDCSTVGGGNGNAATGSYSTVGGGAQNTAGGEEAAVGGGGGNSASGPDASVGGGLGNAASGFFATVGGGQMNEATGGVAAVGGGEYNQAKGNSATIGGGAYNSAGAGATVAGGEANLAYGSYATVPGGTYNSASGAYSLAAGRRASANNAGCFVWGDSTDAGVACNDNNRWVARASGGVYFYSSSDLSTGSYLAAGSGSWSSVSDRALKDNLTPVNGQEVLASLAEIPITTWNYQAQDASIRHMGPMAQDFRNAFGLGESDTAISTVDADGVALAAIQGLYKLAQEKDAQISAQQKRIDDLETRVTALEGGAGVNGGSASPVLPALSPMWLLPVGLLLVSLVVVQRRRAGGR